MMPMLTFLFLRIFFHNLYPWVISTAVTDTI